MAMLQDYDRVHLVTDFFQSSGAALYDIGCIIEVYDNGGYKIEFSDTDGVTKAQTVAYEKGL